MSDVYHFIYSLPLPLITLLMLCGIFVWAWLGAKSKPRAWLAANGAFAVAATAAILYITVFSRAGSVQTLILEPFAAVKGAAQQPEAYRTLLMNIFLFFPLGLAFSNALSQKWSCLGRAALTTLVGCILSSCVEYVQHRYSLGVAEADDVICNTLGAFLGAASVLVSKIFEKRR